MVSFENGRAFCSLRDCQDVLRQQLGKPLFQLFHELTGLHLQVWWRHIESQWGPDAPPKLCPRARRRPAHKLPDRCVMCLRQCWQHAWHSPDAERRFAGLCGSANYRAGLDCLDLQPATLLVQQSARAARADRGNFTRAVGLTRLIRRGLEAVLEKRQAESELGRVREAIKRAAPGQGLETPAVLSPGNEAPKEEAAASHAKSSRAQRLVLRMLDYIHEHYRSPMQLGDMAAALNLNAAYVSSLFSAATGVTFHHYLEDLRLAKAKELLRDPARRVRQVADAVGYPNPNYFREVFRERVGVSPSAWRNDPGPPAKTAPAT